MEERGKENPSKVSHPSAPLRWTALCQQQGNKCREMLLPATDTYRGISSAQMNGVEIDNCPHDKLRSKEERMGGGGGGR